MGATNKTTNYELPVFVGTDKPAWLVDWNGAMNTIDTAIKEAKTAGDNAQTTANTATNDIATLSGSVSTISSTVASQGTAIAGNTGAINTINSLIGNGEPTTTDKTIIGAINDIAAEIPSGNMAADHVTYDNTTSGLTADDVQEAIDELASAAPATPTAAQVSYDNTTSGLTADDVQEAIDELAASIPSAGGITYSTSEVDTGDVWIDGKHIFRKCYTYSGSALTGDVTVDANITNAYVDKIINIKGTNTNTSNRIRPLGFYTASPDEERVLPTVDDTGFKLAATNYSITAYDIVIEYTKATVTP